MEIYRVISLVVCISQGSWISYAGAESPDYCLESYDSGPCEAATSRWFYDAGDGECKEFTYGGCKGNKNNFEDKEACEQACHTDCGNQMCMIECAEGFKLDKRGCKMCECNPEKSADCGNQMCMIECIKGFKLDERGCKMCECNPEESSECGNQMCMIECTDGFKKDSKGCNLCECMPEKVLYTDKCEKLTCDAPLECKVFQLTMSGHRVPRCVDPSKSDSCQAPMDAGPCKALKSRWFYNVDKQACEEFTYGGCRGNANNFQNETSCKSSCIEEDGSIKADQCDNKMCLVYCEAGFKKDSKGCDVCECEEVCQSDTICGLSCHHGLKKDDKGCQVCECLEKPPCLKDIECARECTYGFVVLDDGCQLCECQKEPCADVTCGPDEQCKNKKIKGNWMGKCVSLHKLKPWCGMAMCAMACEHGFSTDQYGCAECRCLDSPPACTLEECDVECAFGLSYDQNGCRTCECLPSPCQLDTCPMTEVCEVKVRHKCTSCPATFTCLAQDDVKRVKISIHYSFSLAHKHIDGMHRPKLRKVFQAQLADMLQVDDEILKGLKVQVPSKGTLSVSFHLVSFSGNNLVELYETFKEKVSQHTDHSTVLFDDHSFIPEHRTLAAQYHSDMEVPEEDLWDEWDEEEEDENMTQTITIIAAVAGGCIALVVIVVILAAIIRSKTKHKGQYEKNKRSKQVVYKKAPDSEEA